MKKIEEGWILVTCDLPSEEGSFRKRVLRRLRRLGALQFTESVYYMPYTMEGIRAAREISDKSGAVFVWYSKVQGEDARFLTNQFVLTSTSDIEDLESAVWKVEDLVESGQDVVWRMKSLNMKYRGLVKAAELIEFEPLAERLAHLRQRIDAIKKRLEMNCRNCKHFTSLGNRPFCSKLRAFLAPEILSRPCDNFEAEGVDG